MTQSEGNAIANIYIYFFLSNKEQNQKNKKLKKLHFHTFLQEI